MLEFDNTSISKPNLIFNYEVCLFVYFNTYFLLVLYPISIESVLNYNFTVLNNNICKCPENLNFYFFLLDFVFKFDFFLGF